MTSSTPFISPFKLSTYLIESIRNRTSTPELFTEDIIELIIECVYDSNPSNRVYLIVYEYPNRDDLSGPPVEGVFKDLSVAIEHLLSAIRPYEGFDCLNPQSICCGCLLYYHELCEERDIVDTWPVHLIEMEIDTHYELGRYLLTPGGLDYQVFYDGRLRETITREEELEKIKEAEPFFRDWFNEYKEARRLFVEGSERKRRKIE